MLYHPLLEFISNHAFISFFLAWPISITLIGICWGITGTISTSINATVNLLLGLAGAIVTIWRGHPPVARWIPDDQVTDTPQRSDDFNNT